MTDAPDMLYDVTDDTYDIARLLEDLKEVCQADASASWRYPFDAQQAAMSAVLAAMAHDAIHSLLFHVKKLGEENTKLRAARDAHQTEIAEIIREWSGKTLEWSE